MMHLAVVTTGTLCGRVTLDEAGNGIVIGREMLGDMGVRDGDEIEVHSDGRMLILLPVRIERDEAQG